MKFNYKNINLNIGDIHDLPISFAEHFSDFVTDDNSDTPLNEFYLFIDLFKTEFEKNHTYTQSDAAIGSVFELCDLNSICHVPLNAKDVLWNELKEGLFTNMMVYKTMFHTLKMLNIEQSIKESVELTKLTWCFDNKSSYKTNYTLGDEQLSIETNISQ